jgi:hypothetical protein
MVLKINTTENESLKTHTMRLPQEMICERFRSDLFVPARDSHPKDDAHTGHKMKNLQTVSSRLEGFKGHVSDLN